MAVHCVRSHLAVRLGYAPSLAENIRFKHCVLFLDAFFCAANNVFKVIALISGGIVCFVVFIGLQPKARFLLRGGGGFATRHINVKTIQIINKSMHFCIMQVSQQCFC